MVMSSATSTIPVADNSPICQALIDAACLEIYRKNAFRITGLPVNASAKEIAKQAGRLKIMEELRHGESANSFAFALNPSPSVDQIRESIQQIRDPEKRLLDEFFWFWPMTFGNRADDPGLDALMRGDASSAYNIWLAAENNTDSGFVAAHNIAVMCHLLAVEWTLYHIAGVVDYKSEDEERIYLYWRQSFIRWRQIASDDRIWNAVKTRIRSLDDPRLTTGFGRRMCDSLLDALARINAEAALEFAEQGKLQWARSHVGFMREIQPERGNLVKTAESVLSPARARLKQQIDRARQRAGNNQSEALAAGHELLEHAREFSYLFDLFFGTDSEVHNELSDEVATACNQITFPYHKATADNKGCIELLKSALPFASSSDLRQEIKNNINLLMLRDIDESGAAPKAKLARIKLEIMPAVDTIVPGEFANFVAISLRGISIDAHNEHDDFETALEALTLASDLAREPELKNRLAQDKSQIQANQKVRTQLLLKIRGDEIEVTRERVRYNSHVLPSGDINGIRFGVFVRGDLISYMIAVNSARHGSIHIECKRFFRSEQKAQADFQAILGALYYQIIPRLCLRMARYLAAGNTIPLGDCWMTFNGIHITTGMLFWSEDHVIPWSDVGFNTQSGQLHLASTQKRNVFRSFSLRRVWNAVILKELAEAVVALQSKKPTS